MKTMRNNYFVHELLPTVTIKREEVDGTRFYRVPTGGLYPSVTTVLSSMSKQGITQWRESVGKEKAERVMRSAAARGTGTHQICEDYMLNKDDYLRGAMPTSISLFKQIQKYLDIGVGKVYGVEIPLYSDKLKSAGTCDLLCQLHGMNAVVDFKTSTKAKKEEHIINYFYQATAYALMAEEIYKMTIPYIGIVIATEEEGPQIFLKHTSKYREIVTSFFENYSCNNS